MKKQIPLIVLALSLIFAGAASAAAVSPALEVLAGEEALIVSGTVGEPVFFSPESLKEAVNSNSFESVTILSLPSPADGTLYFNDAAVAPNQDRKSVV